MNSRRILTTAVFLLAALVASLSAQNPIPPSPRIVVSRPTPAPSPVAEVPAASSASGAASSSAAGASSDYVLAPADTVDMTVFHQPDLATQAKIANDGSVQFPLIGELKIGGLTLRDARETIRRRYNSDYLVEPQVYLNVLAYAQRKFTILGQVGTPGTFMIPGGEHLGLLEAVGMAGGFTRLANRSTVSVRRDDQTVKVNAKKLNTPEGKKFEVQAGDVITVGESIF